MIKTRGSPTDSQNSAVSVIVGSWNDAARLDFQMHIARRFQNGGLGPHFFEHRNRTIQLPLIDLHLKKTSVFSALLFLRHRIDKISSQFCYYFWSVKVTINFSGSSNINKWVFREIDRRLSYRLHWANDAVWYVPFFRIPLSDLWFILLFQATYLRHVNGFLKSRLPDQTAIPYSYLHISQIFWMLTNKYRQHHSQRLMPFPSQ